MLRVKEVPPGALFYLSEHIGDDQNNTEVREVFYVRDPDRLCQYPHNVPVGRIATIQGDPSSGEPPRYRRVNDPICRDPGEMDGRAMCHLLAKRTSVWELSI